MLKRRESTVYEYSRLKVYNLRRRESRASMSGKVKVKYGFLLRIVSTTLVIHAVRRTPTETTHSSSLIYRSADCKLLGHG